MKTKVRLEVLVFLAICLVFSYACSKRAEDTGWSASIEIVDGIKVVTNPEEPKFGVFVFELEEDLAIGDPNDEDYFFHSRLTLNVDEDGNFYVCDSGNKRIQKYDKSGTYVRSIGRQGRGPGEYMSPSRIFLDDVGNLCVSDFRSFLYYDKDGIFQKKITLKNSYSRIIASPNGTFFGSTQARGQIEGGAKTTLVLVGENGEPIQTIAEYSVSYSNSLKTLVLHWYTNFIAHAFRTPDAFYYGFSNEYKVIVANKDGSTNFIFLKDEPPKSISLEEKELTKKDGLIAVMGPGLNEKEKATVFPNHQPYFRTFFSDDTGRLYVIRFKSILERHEQNISVDIFSREGIYLYQMNWSFMPALIKKGFLYEIREDENTGDTKVLRHKIINWNKFKEE